MQISLIKGYTTIYWGRFILDIQGICPIRPRRKSDVSSLACLRNLPIFISAKQELSARKLFREQRPDSAQTTEVLNLAPGFHLLKAPRLNFPAQVRSSRESNAPGNPWSMVRSPACVFPFLSHIRIAPMTIPWIGPAPSRKS